MEIDDFEVRKLFRELEFWVDGVPRRGEEAMAIDEWLLETRQRPLLRVYGWDGNWGSVGYFGKIEEARTIYPEVDWVRRWTGGGIVDHRNDWTYSLIVPSEHELARMRGGDSYREIHSVLAEVLRKEMDGVKLAGDGAGGDVCFTSPVEFDIVDQVGRKLAGAGQRRTKIGLLHQGSVALRDHKEIRARLFVELLADDIVEVNLEIDEERIKRLVEERYEFRGWLHRR